MSACRESQSAAGQLNFILKVLVWKYAITGRVSLFTGECNFTVKERLWWQEGSAAAGQWYFNLKVSRTARCPSATYLWERRDCSRVCVCSWCVCVCILRVNKVKQTHTWCLQEDKTNKLSRYKTLHHAILQAERFKGHACQLQNTCQKYSITGKYLNTSMDSVHINHEPLVSSFEDFTA